ncbi:hypothetical protein WUBG_17459, partial [Wuchereria bancrofti]
PPATPAICHPLIPPTLLHCCYLLFLPATICYHSQPPAVTRSHLLPPATNC